MMLFNAVVDANPVTYAVFRESCVSGYAETARHTFDVNVFDRA